MDSKVGVMCFIDMEDVQWILIFGRPKIQSTLQPRIPPCCHDLESRLGVQPIPHQPTDVTPCHATTKGKSGKHLLDRNPERKGLRHKC